jgi:O-succinylbenzoate synthase
MVQEAVRTPLCLDEAVNTPEQADMALELHSCKWVKIDPGRVGGLTPALAIYKKCLDASTPCWVGMPLMTALGERTYLSLASKSNFTYPADHQPGGHMLIFDLADRALPTPDAEGRQRVPMWSLPGIGVDPDPTLLAQYAVAKAKL